MKGHGIASLIVLALAATQVSGQANQDSESSGAHAQDGRQQQPVKERQQEDTSARPVPEGEPVPVPYANVCPLALVGQMNGIYYYYARACGDCSYTSIADTVPHVIDYDCKEPCTTGTQICHEQSGTHVRTNRDHVRLPTHAARKGAKPGHPADPNDGDGYLYLSGVHITHRKTDDGVLISDEYVRVEPERGGRRYFRVFALEINLGGSKHPFNFGQEIDRQHPPATHDGEYRGRVSQHEHEIDVTINGVTLSRVPVITRELWETTE